MTPSHPIRRLLLAEDLVRRRRSTESRRYVGSQRCGRIDPNPHQIDAVMFALGRVREGGCILADEVGLGKTIEAGLVIAQLLAEGARRVLLVAPKPLLGQWRNELFELFAIEATEGQAGAGGFDGDGVFLVGREFVGTEAGALALTTSDGFDLCVVDEAHEVFAGIYRRYDRHGVYDPESKQAKTAGKLRDLLRRSDTPVLLLTATPIQNSLAELWGLVQYVDPSGTLLGDIATFRQLFCDGDDRQLVAGQEDELKRRMEVVLKRTLRRQAQDFMSRPFVDRTTRLFEYDMSPEETQLYDDVTDYLLRPSLCAFRGKQRRLLLIGFHRRMASSHRALAVSLDKVRDRLKRMLDGEDDDGSDALAEFSTDLEDFDDVDVDDVDESQRPTRDAITAELELVERFADRARNLKTDGKARKLLQAVRLAAEREKQGESTGKLVIFTESLTTQDYIRDLLLDSRLVTDQEVTLFRGTNDTPRAQEALDRWNEEVASKRHTRPSRDVAVRLALVHEFQTRSKIFVSTEAGAKGLNLQFCDTLINYDLPWNPQRIEQRIGRCHRYGQKQGVTVINFIARGNETQRLTFEILSQKLELFGTVLDASDEVLHAPGKGSSENLAGAMSSDFESSLRRIYERARSLEEIEEDLRELRETMEARKAEFEDVRRRTTGIIESQFDQSVRKVFKGIEDSLPLELAQFDRDVERVVVGYLDALDIPYRRTESETSASLVVGASDRLPEDLQQGLTVVFGDAANRKESDPVHVGHPLVRAAVVEARQSVSESKAVRLVVPDDSVAAVAKYRGHRGRLVVVKVQYGGFEPVERILPLMLLPDGESIDGEAAGRILDTARFETSEALGVDIAAEDVEDSIEEALFVDEQEVAEDEERQFTRAMQQLERFVDDRVMVLGRRRRAVAARLVAARAEYDAAAGAANRTKAERSIARIESELEALDDTLERLRARDDDEYEVRRQTAHTRRYEAPEHTVLLDVEFVIDERGG